MPQALISGQDCKGKLNCSLECFMLFGVVIFIYDIYYNHVSLHLTIISDFLYIPIHQMAAKKSVCKFLKHTKLLMMFL